MECPKCKAQNVEKTKHGFAICRTCGDQFVTDINKWRVEYIDLSTCPDCWSTGVIYDSHKQSSKCNKCDGTGWIGLEFDDGN